MASSTFAPEAGHVPNSSASYSCSPPSRQQQQQQHHLNQQQQHSGANNGRSHSNSIDRNNTNNIGVNESNSNSNSDNNSNSILHAHRQNHNSSKLPAFRFADLKKEALAFPGLLQQHQHQQHQEQRQQPHHHNHNQNHNHLPPSPLSPSPNSGHCSSPESGDQRHDPDSHKQGQQSQQIALQPPQNDLHDTKTPASPPSSSKPSASTSASTPASASVIPHRPQSSPTRNRASTFQISSSKPTHPAPSASKRPASFPDNPTLVVKVNGVDLASPTSTSTSGRPQPSPIAVATTKDWAQGQRELLLPKTIDSAKTDDKKKSRPPVSFRPPNSGRAVIPPIRSFRSSGSRKSLVLDMHARRTSYDSGEESYDSNHLDRTLMALEGRSDDDYSRITPPDSAEPIPDNENTADIFMRIAREDPARSRVPDPIGSPEDRSAVIARVARTTHARPVSVAVPSYHTSPPQMTRRLSDQRENGRNRRITDNRSAQQMTRELNYRGVTKDQPTPSAQNGEDSSLPQLARVSLRPSPITPRNLTFQEPFADGNSAYSRRRPSLTDSNSGLPSRPSQYRTSNLLHGQARTYNSSPLAPRSADPHRQDVQPTPETIQGVEGTESSASTAGQSTVWDELDDLKSRIYRLELTGKAPSTSGAAMSRVSDERPPTATTNATTMSASPKRTCAGAAQVDASSTTSSQREAQPILFSALSKTRGLVTSDVYDAIESAATEALALSSMMGTPGQPGPISSGASTIGVGGSVTDRQLRRKAESICRSLTELCLALTESSSSPSKLPQNAPTQREREDTTPTVTSPTVTSPTVTKFSANTSHRRPNAVATDQALTRLNSSPRAGTSLEQRRTTLLGPTALPSPRFAAAPRTPIDAGRKSSLLLARTRRAGTEEYEEPSGRRSSLLIGRSRRGGTEEPEEPSGRKSSLLLRTRRAATEEPEEGRRTTLLSARRAAADEEDDEETRFRAPSRAATEVNGFRATPREYPTQAQAADNSSLGSSALPRRRFVSSTLNGRATGPSAMTPTAGRRFIDRPTPERESNSVVEKLAEDRGQRQLSLSQTAMLNRTGSLSRRRNSGIPSLPSTNTQAGSYR